MVTIPNRKVLFINTHARQCGIYLFGFNIGKALTSYQQGSNTYYYAEPKSLTEFETIKNTYDPDVIIVNYVREQFPWLSSYYPVDSRTYINILHENTIDTLKSFFSKYYFKYTLQANPLPTAEENVFSLPRLLPDINTKPFIEKNPITIGSIGFGVLDRGWLQVIDKVQQEYDEANIKFQMPFNSVVDPKGEQFTLKTAAMCKSKILKPGISLSINHRFLEVEEAVNWLSENTINLALYQEQTKKGISSQIDFALAANRPLGISSSPMFDHLSDVRDLICVDSNSIESIVKLGTSVLDPYRKIWCKESFCRQVDAILNKCV